MALYIMLSTLSETGRQVVRKLPGSIRKVKNLTRAASPR